MSDSAETLYRESCDSSDGDALTILYHHRIASKDGQIVHIDEIVRALKLLGHHVSMVSPAQMSSRKFGEGSGTVAFVRKKLPRFVGELLELAYNIPDIFKLLRSVKQSKPAFIYERHNLFVVSGVALAKLLKIPLILEVNAPLSEERAKNNELSLTSFATRLEHWVWRQADHVLPVTSVLARDLVDSGVDERKITVIHNGVQRGSIASNQPSRDDSRITVGFTGFIRTWHRLDRVLQVIAENPVHNILFVVIGDGPDRPRIEALANTLGLQDRVRFCGLVERDSIQQQVRGFDIAVQPDVTAYASPLKLFEYMAAGAAVIAPDEENIREVLTHGHDALLFGSGGSNGFEACLGQLVQDKKLRVTLGKNAQNTVDEQEFYWERNAERIVEIGRALSDKQPSERP